MRLDHLLSKENASAFILGRLRLVYCLVPRDFSGRLFFENRIEEDEERGKGIERDALLQRPSEVKIIRAYGGCLGAKSRRRTRSTAKSFGEPQAGFDPEISEWGNLAGVISSHRILNP